MRSYHSPHAHESAARTSIAPVPVRFLYLLTALLVNMTQAALGQHPARFDLISEFRDLNGLLLDPTWGDSVRRPGTLDPEEECGILALHGIPGFRRVLIRDPKCFSPEQLHILRIDEPKDVKVGGFICSQPSEDGSVHGHVNWFPVTMTGILRFESYSAGEGGDWDFTFNLLSTKRWPVTRWNWPSPRLAAKDSLQRIHVEIDYNETFAHLPRDPNGWWHDLANAALHQSPSQVDRFLGQVQATVTGLYTLDAVHEGHAELHPVFAMALLVSSDTIRGRQIRQHWALLARDRGNEGNCAFGEIPFATDKSNMSGYRFLLAAPRGSSGPPLIAAESTWLGATDSVTGVAVYWTPGQGLELWLRWPVPQAGSRRALVMGNVYLTWPVSFDERATLSTASQDERLIHASQEAGAKFRPRSEDVKNGRAHAPLDSSEHQPTVLMRPLTMPDSAVLVDTMLPHAPPQSPVPAEIFDPIPQVLTCAEVTKNLNPRCAGDWSIAPSISMRSHDAALDNRLVEWSASLGWEGPRMDILVHNLHFRPTIAVTSRLPKNRAVERSQTRYTLRAGLAAGPWVKVFPLYLVANPELSVIHEAESRWRPGLSGGLGYKFRDGYRLDVAAEVLVTTGKGQSPFFMLGLRTPFVAPF